MTSYLTGAEQKHGCRLQAFGTDAASDVTAGSAVGRTP